MFTLFILYTVKVLYLPLQYVAWHYQYGLPHLFLITRELVRFVFNLFSISLFLRTLFKPMLSLQGSTKGEEIPVDVVSIIVANLVMRVLGFLTRTILILSGIVGITLTILSMSIIIILWTFLPLIILLGVYLSMEVILNYYAY